uniref:Putative GT4 n=1 Tax=Magnetococcus massalia (strain MO-1) TaxID=451514 RepID=A0A1S7LPR0_MAGMO|nr:Putative GT4 [Candidatus Magnetococcus massalia]
MHHTRPSILALAPHGWNDRWLSRQQLMTRLGQRQWPVLYSYGPLSVWQRGSQEWQAAHLLSNTAAQDHVLVDQPGRLFPRWPSHPLWDRFAEKQHALRMGRALDSFGERERILFLFHPRYWPYVEILKPRWVVYHIYDVFSIMDNWSAQMDHYQAQLVQRADLITTSSPGMAENLPGSGPQKGRVLNNGANPHPFVAAEGCVCPADLAQIPSPRIGYIGTVNSKLDLEMVHHVATLQSHWHWVFIGPVMVDAQDARSQEAKALWQKCLALPNVHLLGAKGRDEVPAYVQHMDVNTICYRIRPDDWVIHGYPVKLHEYLATGKPVVAAAQNAVKQFDHVVSIPESPEQWVDALKAAITTGGVGTPEARRQVALSNTWDQRTDTLELWLEEMMRG